VPTNYPGALDAFTNPTSGDDLDSVGVVHSEQHANINDAVEAMQAELGTDPSAGFATVAARFTDVESDVDALEATVAALPGGDVRVFDAVAYGALVDGTTDDTGAWQDAIDAAAAAGGGIVTSSVNGVSVIAGALQDTGGANAQLLLPAVHVTSGEQVSITIRGVVPAPTDISVIGSVVLPVSHLVLKSTLASGTGAVIGAKGPSGSPGDFTNVHLRVENLTVRTVSNPTITGLDLRRVAMVDVDGVVVDCGSYNVSGLTQPTSSGSYGIRAPQNNNGAHTVLGRVDVIGFYTGYEFAEHAVGTDVAAWGCKVAAEFDATNHASVFTRFMAIHCERVLKFTGVHAVDVWQLDIEHAASGWMTTDYDLDDASNFGKGFLRWHAVLAGTGDHNSFTVNGGSGFTTSRVGAAIGSGGGGSTVYSHRDRLVASAGNTTLTLGASPVAGSPVVWVNNIIKWPGTDYAITGAVATFTTPLSASDVVLVKYESTTSTYVAATLTTTGVNIADTFNRADSTSALGTTTTGAKTWVQTAGTWGIASNKAYVSSGTASQVCIATVDAGVADCTISATMTAGSNSNAGIAFRVTDALNFYQVDTKVAGGTNVVLFKCVAGAFTAITIPAASAFVSGDIITVVLSGTGITLKKNGTTFASVTDSTFTTQTKHGLYVEAGTGVSSPARFDDFSIQP
jgi:hypothetical protein